MTSIGSDRGAPLSRRAALSRRLGRSLGHRGIALFAVLAVVAALITGSAPDAGAAAATTPTPTPTRPAATPTQPAATPTRPAPTPTSPGARQAGLTSTATATAATSTNTPTALATATGITATATPSATTTGTATATPTTAGTATTTSTSATTATATATPATVTPTATATSTPAGTAAAGSLSVTLSATAPNGVYPGYQIVYTLSYANTGTAALTNATLLGAAPAGTSWVAGSGGTLGADGQTLTFPIGTLGAGASGSVSFTVTVGAGAGYGTTISNAAFGIADGIGTVSTNQVVLTVGTGTNTTATVTPTPTTGGLLTLTKSVSAPNGVYPGYQIVYTLAIANPTASSLTNVAVTDAVPAGATWVPGSGGSLAADGRTLVFAVGTLPGGTSGSFSFTVTVNPSTALGTVLTNAATATADGGVSVSSNTVSATVGSAVTATATPTSTTLQAVKSAYPASGSAVASGTTIQYSITVTNGSASALSNVTVVDTVPAGTVLLTGSAGAGVVSGTQVTWTTPTLGAGASATFSFSVQVIGGGLTQPAVPGYPGYVPGGYLGYLPGNPTGYLPGSPTGYLPGGAIVNTAQASATGVATVTTNQVQHTVLGAGYAPYPVTGVGGLPIAGGIGGVPGSGIVPGPVGIADGGIVPIGGSGPINPLAPVGPVPQPIAGPDAVPIAGTVPPPPQAPPASGSPASSHALSSSYNAVGDPAAQVFLPLVSGGQAGLSSVITLFNASGQPNQIGIQYVGPDGASARTDSVNLPANGSVSYSAVPGSFLGAAVLTGQQPVAAVVTLHRQNGDDLAYAGVPAGQTAGPNAGTLFLPLIFQQYQGWTSDIAVQNAGAAPADVTVTYRSSDPAAGGGPAPGTVTEQATIPPGAMHRFNQPAGGAVPGNWVGGAVVTSSGGQPLTAYVSHANAGTPAGMGYIGIYTAQAGPAIHAPLLMKGHNGWDTGLQVQNVGSQPTTVRIEYAAAGASGVQASDTGTLQPGESRTFFTPSAPGLPADFVGSAVVTSDNGQPLAAVVNQTKYQLGTAMAYTAPAAGANAVIAPLAYDASDSGYSSGVQVQNLTAQPAPVNVQLFAEGGQSVAQLNDTLAPNGAATYYLPALAQVPKGFRGAVVVTSVNGQPLAAIVNDVAYR